MMTLALSFNVFRYGGCNKMNKRENEVLTEQLREEKIRELAQEYETFDKYEVLTK